MNRMTTLGILCLAFAGSSAEPAQTAPAYTLAFSTYYGGSLFEQIRDITTDAAGNVYITGGTESTNYPTTVGAYDRSHNGWFDVFITKFSPAGAVLWSTLLGGPNYDRAYGIEVDNAGFVYVSGRSGPGFPTTAGAFQTAYLGYNTGAAYGQQNAFISKLRPDGSGLVWSTYFGTAGMNRDFDIDKATGEITVASTYEPAAGQQPFPGSWFAGGFQSTPPGGMDNVVAKVSASGASLLWATYVGGSGNESGKNSLRLDSAGSVLLFTNTNSTDMPVPGGYQTSFRGVQDFYLAKIRPDGSGLVFGTYFGGSDSDWCETHHLAVDSSNNVYISGITHSPDLPTTAGAFQTAFGGINGVTHFHATGDAFAAKFSPSGALLRSTYVGGRYGDCAQGLAVDSQGNVYFTGGTVSDNFPLAGGAVQPTYRGGEDWIAVALAADFSRLLYSTYLGSTGYDEGRTAWCDANGTFYVAGETAGTNWAVVNAAQPAYAGGNGDNYLAKFVPAATPQPPAAPSGVAILAGDGRATLAWNRATGATSTNVYMAAAPGVTKANYASLPGGMRHAGATSPFVHTGLANGTTYSFVVTAVNANGESVESAEVSVTPTAGGWPIVDTDGDGYSDAAEIAAGSNPNDPASRPGDADGDGMADAWETANLGGTFASPSGDPDGDGLSNLAEYNLGTDPNLADTDGDGFTDSQEVSAGTDPLDPLSFPAGGGATPSSSGHGGCGLTGLEAFMLLGLLARRRRSGMP